jgi:FMN phosphatase YigB (HAD superfamily)
MPLTLEQYIERLDSRTDLPWPSAPRVDPPKAKSSLHAMPVKAVFWTVYGTLVAIPSAELLFEHPQNFVTTAALEKLIKEFKMWQSMSRKPGAPSEYMKELCDKALTTLRLTGGGGGERFPEVQSERIWEDILKKLGQKEYSYDIVQYGSLIEYAKKISYFYHASIQGAGAYPGAADALTMLAQKGVVQGLLGDGQCFTPGQLQRCLKQQNTAFNLDSIIPSGLRIISAERKARKPSDTLFKAAIAAAGAKGVNPSAVLHVGSSLVRDIAPAKKHGFRTALFAGDRNSLSAGADQLKDPMMRPDALITELPQVLELIA